MMRNLPDVIDQILAAIPEDAEVGELRYRLEKRRDGFGFCAPELQPKEWATVADYLEYHIGVPVEPWQKHIQDIFADRTSSGARRGEGDA